MGIAKFGVTRREELGRLALQLAVQLPESGDEARQVIDDVADLLENYITRAPRLIWDRRRLSGIPPSCGPAAVFWTAASFLLMAPIAIGLSRAIDLQAPAVLALSFAVLACGLVFGVRYGLGAAALAILTHNLFISAPLFVFDMPSRLELVFACFYLAAGGLVPLLARHAATLRGLAMTSCGSGVAGPAARSPS